MTFEICFTIPDSIVESEFKRYLQDNMDVYREAMDLTGDYFDRLSQVDRIEITHVELEETSVAINYIVEYSGFRACHDLRYSEENARRTIGKRNDRTFLFEKFQPLEQRSTCDEL